MIGGEQDLSLHVANGLKAVACAEAKAVNILIQISIIKDSIGKAEK